MPYRPSFPGFELNAGSAIAGVFPASFQAAMLTSFLVVSMTLVSGFTEVARYEMEDALYVIPGFVLLMLLVTTVATVFCALHIALVGVPLAWLLGQRLDTPAGLAISSVAALASALVVCAVFGAWPFGTAETWPFTALVAAYALPSGLLYRRAVLAARSFSPFAELDAA